MIYIQNLEFLTKNGQEFAILPYDEFRKIQEILKKLKHLENIEVAKNTQKDGSDELLNIIEENKKKSSKDWTRAIKQIEKENTVEQITKIRNLLFTDCYELDDEQEQKEILRIIQSLEGINI